MKSLSVRIRKLFLVLIVVALTSYQSLAQTDSKSKKILKYYEKAEQSYINHNYEEALENVNKTLSLNDSCLDALLLKAELGLELNDDMMSIESYEKMFMIDSMFYPNAAISLSRLYAKTMQYDKSIELLNWFLLLDNHKDYYSNLAYEELKRVEFKKELYSNPVSYEPRNIGNMVNSYNDEYVNQYYVYDKKLIFTRHYVEEEKKNSLLKEDVLVSVKYDSLWTLPHFMFDNVFEVGAVNVSPNGHEIFFSACEREDGHGSCDIYFMYLHDGQWSAPINIHSINSSDWESQPCLTPDGKELYFVRANKKAANSDIYVAYRTENGDWSKPKRLGDNINTMGNEMAPFIHCDGKTMYFSSDGRPGMGGFDLFVSRRYANGEWTPAVNLGYPLNTAEGDEINLVVSNDATKAYMSSDRAGGFGAYDIYEFDLDEKFRPQEVEIATLSVDELYANAFDKREIVTVKDIYFGFDSSELTPESEKGILALCRFLNLYKDVNIVLIGHTDDSGKESYNQMLSVRRANSVRHALINNGISSGRIKTKGCGSTQPLFPNNSDDDELRALNRRVSMGFEN